MEIGIIYFSGTGITQKYAEYMKNELENIGHGVSTINILIDKEKTRSFRVENYDALIFGFPIYGGRLPIPVEKWIETLTVTSKKCSMYFTYGARANENGNQVAYFLLNEAGFTVVLSAEFIGAHSYNVAEGWLLADDRPNEEDFKVAKEFVNSSIERFTKEKIDFKVDMRGFKYKKRDYIKRGGPFAIFLPYRDSECSMCLLCEENCPTNAFNAESGQASDIKCISCMYCLKNCPDQAIKVGNATELYKSFKKRCDLTEKNIKEKKSIIFK